MKITVWGSNPKLSKDETKVAAMFMMAHLVDEKMCNKLKVDIRFVNFRGANKKRGMWGQTIWSNDNEMVPRTFRISINKSMGKIRQLQVLGHELTHVKQFALGELDPAGLYWKGARIDRDLHYFDTPQEIDACGREYGLWRRYADYILEHKKKCRRS